MMQLLADWRQLLLKAWSVRLALTAALLSAAEIAVQVLATVRPTPWFAMAAAAVSLSAAIARVVAQPHMHQDPSIERMREARGLLPAPGESMPPEVFARLQGLLT